MCVIGFFNALNLDCFAASAVYCNTPNSSMFNHSVQFKINRCMFMVTFVCFAKSRTTFICLLHRTPAPTGAAAFPTSQADVLSFWLHGTG